MGCLTDLTLMDTNHHHYIFGKEDICNSGHATITAIHAQLLDESHPLTLGDFPHGLVSRIDIDLVRRPELVPCGREIVTLLRNSADPSSPREDAYRDLEHLESISEKEVKLNANTRKIVPLHIRRLYTDCRLLHSLLDLQESHRSEDDLLRAIRRLDMAIIISGAPGESRLEFILDTINIIQSQRLPLVRPISRPNLEVPEAADNLSSVHVNPVAGSSIRRIEPPSFFQFSDKSYVEPFILPGFIRDWPALNDHPWHSAEYLLRIAGRGRVVPVEVGSDYRSEEWNQKLMPWEDFLQGIGMNPQLSGSSEGIKERPDGGRQSKETLYLAQHTLLTQFPALRTDIIVPDYVYASPSATSTFPGYRPPNNEEQLVINAWLGPEGTISPAHTDPYFNCYAQVMGRKTIWLAPPHLQEQMYPFSNPHAPHTARETSEASSPPNSEPLLANTSRVDVFMPSHTQFPLFVKHVQQHALCSILEPGDMLYIPPGWWHAMRSEDISFSVSMWF